MSLGDREHASVIDGLRHENEKLKSSLGNQDSTLKNLVQSSNRSSRDDINTSQEQRHGQKQKHGPYLGLSGLHRPDKVDAGAQTETFDISMVSEVEHRQLIKKYQELEIKFQNTAMQTKIYERRIMTRDKQVNRLKGKFSRAKDAIKEWQRYADCQTPTKPDPVSSIQPHPINLSDPEPNSSSTSRQRDPVGCQALKASSLLGERTGSHNHGAPHNEANDVQTKANTTKETQVGIGSSQKTDDIQPSLNKVCVQPANTTPDDSPPKVISERLLKRKRPKNRNKVLSTPHRSRVWYGDGSSVKPIEIKEENSSPPLQSKVPKMVNSETLDLDEIHGPIDTPRKRRQLERMRSNLGNGGFFQRNGADLTQQRCASMPADMQDWDETLAHHQSQALTRSFDGRQFRQMDEVNTDESTGGLLGEVDRLDPKHNTVLQPLSVNRRILPWDEMPTRFAKRREQAKARDKKLHYFAEDGESLIRSKHGQPEPNKQTNENANSNSRITALLDTPALNKHNMQPPDRSNAFKHPLDRQASLMTGPQVNQAVSREPRPGSDSRGLTVTTSTADQSAHTLRVDHVDGYGTSHNKRSSRANAPDVIRTGQGRPILPMEQLATTPTKQPPGRNSPKPTITEVQQQLHRSTTLSKSLSTSKGTLSKAHSPSDRRANQARLPFTKKQSPTTPSNPPQLTNLPKPRSRPSASSTTSSNHSKPRLREQPKHALRPSDFKLNPCLANALTNPNHPNYPYAYEEPIRGHARTCLPGCTRPNCCGDLFRKFAEAGGADLPSARAPKPSIFDVPSSSPADEDAAQRDEEDRLLEDYLGEEEAARLALPKPPSKDRKTMTEDEERQRREALARERTEMILQARGARLARGLGRHRERFERRRTPPGFWRTEMPTTQDLEGDRREAERLEREVVEERWREAVRSGRGRWVFRDE